MGTRHVIVIISEQSLKVAEYGQFDGYPSWAGVKLVESLKSKDLNTLREKLKNVKLFDYGEEGSEHISYSSYEVLDKIYDSTDKLELCNEESFISSGYSCEYVYEIDLDQETFKIYSADQRNKNKYQLRTYSSEQVKCCLLAEYDLNTVSVDNMFEADVKNSMTQETEYHGLHYLTLGEKVINEEDLMKSVKRLLQALDEASQDESLNVGDLIQLEEDAKDLLYDPDIDEELVQHLFKRFQNAKKPD